MSYCKPVTDGGITVDECPKCGGRWYDLGELSRFVKDKERLAKLLDADLIKPRPVKEKCPRCHGEMVNGGLGNEFLRVDLCKKCKGIWLDQNEIRVLMDVLGFGRSAPGSQQK